MLSELTSSGWSYPLMRFGGLNDDVSWMKQSGAVSGLSITEDEGNVYVEAAVPGVKAEDIEISYYQGVLRISGEQNDEERKERKSYTKMTSSYSYQVAIPGEVDLTSDPEATCADGIVTVTFSKVKAAVPRKIAIKTKTSGSTKTRKSAEAKEGTEEEKVEQAVNEDSAGVEKDSEE